MANVNWQEIITSLGGNVILLAAVGWLIKTFLSHRFTLEAEKFKVELKASADTEIERVKAFLARAAHVHELQVDTLTKLYRHFWHAQGYLKRMASTGSGEGEFSADDYRRLWAEAIASARDTLSEGRLLIPLELTHECDRFFNSLFQGQLHLAIAENPMVVNGLQRAAFRNEAQKIALQEIPSILDQIDKAARVVIHGEG